MSSEMKLLAAFAALVVAAGTGLVIWLAVSGGPACPKGQVLTFEYFLPMPNGSGGTYEEPIYDCQPG